MGLLLDLVDLGASVGTIAGAAGLLLLVVVGELVDTIDLRAAVGVTAGAAGLLLLAAVGADALEARTLEVAA